MKIFSVNGISKSGKTTTIENIIKELKRRGYTVGTIKEIHYEKFKIDTEGTNTYRHKDAGAELVTARGYYETDVLFPKNLSIEEILKFYNTDYVIMEGVRESSCPAVLCAHSKEDIEAKKNDEFYQRVFLISGVVSASINEFEGIPVIDSMTNIVGLVDKIEKDVFEMLPDFPPECCSACGQSCRELSALILKGKADRNDCVLKKEKIILKVNNKKIAIVPFVQGILRDSIIAMVKNLKGCEEPANIVIEIND